MNMIIVNNLYIKLKNSFPDFPIFQGFELRMPWKTAMSKHWKERNKLMVKGSTTNKDNKTKKRFLEKTPFCTEKSPSISTIPFNKYLYYMKSN
jgi:hypothetical protein